MSKGKLVQFGIGIIMLMSVFVGCENNQGIINENTIEGVGNSEEIIDKGEEGAGNSEEGISKSEELTSDKEGKIDSNGDERSDILFKDDYIELTYIEKNQSKDNNWNVYKCEVINNYDKCITISYRGNEEKNTYNSIDVNAGEKEEIYYMLDNEEIKDSMFSVYLTNDIEPKLLNDYYISFEEKE